MCNVVVKPWYQGKPLLVPIIILNIKFIKIQVLGKWFLLMESPEHYFMLLIKLLIKRCVFIHSAESFPWKSWRVLDQIFFKLFNCRIQREISKKNERYLPFLRSREKISKIDKAGHGNCVTVPLWAGIVRDKSPSVNRGLNDKINSQNKGKNVGKPVVSGTRTRREHKKD